MTLSKRAQNTGVFISLLAITLLLLYMGISVSGTGDEGVLLALIGLHSCAPLFAAC